MADYYTQAVCNNPDTLPFTDEVDAMFKFLSNGNYQALLDVFGSDEAAEAAVLAFAAIEGSSYVENWEQFFKDNGPDDRTDIEITFLFDDHLNWNRADEGPVEIEGQVYGQYYLYTEESLGSLDGTFLIWAIGRMPAKIKWIVVEYAHTCSKMRPDGFAGGAWFITRDGMSVLNTGTWIEEQIAEFKERSTSVVIDPEIAAMMSNTLEDGMTHEQREEVDALLAQMSREENDGR